jgi:hypothetical protein
MRIKISNHAKRRAKLYGIPESTIVDVLATLNLSQGRQEILKNISGSPYPLKIVVSVEGDKATVITNYPLKKGRKK